MNRFAAGYSDAGAMWRSGQDLKDSLGQDLKDSMLQLTPLYRQLHAYVKRKLVAVYGKHRFPEGGHIPAQLLGEIIE